MRRSIFFISEVVSEGISDTHASSAPRTQEVSPPAPPPTLGGPGGGRVSGVHTCTSCSSAMSRYHCRCSALSTSPHWCRPCPPGVGWAGAALASPPSLASIARVKSGWSEMARCSSCIECWFNVISPSCALTSVAETVLTWFRKHHAYVKGLRAAREAEAAQRGALEASPVFGFSKIKFMLAVSKSYLSVYLVGAAPEKFYIWHALQFAVLLPVQAYRWHHMRGLAYFAEFCWVANVCLAAYLSVIVLAPHLVGASLRGVLYRLAFAFGAGPLQSSVVFLGNSLVPHSIDHLMSLVIHLTPALTAWSLRHAATVDASLFPREVVSFADYVAPPLCFLLVWASFHTFFMLALGPRLRARGLSTVHLAASRTSRQSHRSLARLAPALAATDHSSRASSLCLAVVRSCDPARHLTRGPRVALTPWPHGVLSWHAGAIPRAQAARESGPQGVAGFSVRRHRIPLRSTTLFLASRHPRPCPARPGPPSLLSQTYDYNMSGNASFNAVLGRIGDGRDETACFLKCTSAKSTVLKQSLRGLLIAAGTFQTRQSPSR